ncbi:hypothetical protein COOONC_01036 [Cooperia oncophora]
MASAIPRRTGSSGRIDDKARALLQQRAVGHHNPASTPLERADPQIEEWEEEHALRQMKPGKAPGPDRISVDFLKSASCTVIKQLTNCYSLGAITGPWTRKRFRTNGRRRARRATADGGGTEQSRQSYRPCDEPEQDRGHGNEWADALPFTLEGTALPYTNRYVYLGRLISMDNNLREEIMRRKKCAWTAMGRIKEAAQLISDRKIRALFDSTVLPALRYASETWAENKASTLVLTRAQRTLERTLLNINRREQRCRNLHSIDMRSVGHP